MTHWGLGVSVKEVKVAGPSYLRASETPSAELRTSRRYERQRRWTCLGLGGFGDGEIEDDDFSVGHAL